MTSRESMPAGRRGAKVRVLLFKFSSKNLCKGYVSRSHINNGFKAKLSRGRSCVAQIWLLISVREPSGISESLKVFRSRAVELLIKKRWFAVCV